MERIRGSRDWVLVDPREEFYADVWREIGDQLWGGVTSPGAHSLSTRSRVKLGAMQLFFAAAAPGTIYYIGPPDDNELWIFKGISFWLAHAANPMNSFDLSLLTLGRSIGGGFPGPVAVDAPIVVPDFAIGLSPYLGSFNSGIPFTLTAGQSFAFNALGGGVRMIRRARAIIGGRQCDAIRIHGHGDGANAAMLQVVPIIDRYRYAPPNPQPADV